MTQLRATDLKRLHRTWRRRKSARLGLLLEGLQGPFNVGSIVRTAAGLSVDDVYVVEGTIAPTNPKAQKTAMGTDRYLTIHYTPNVTDATPEQIKAAAKKTIPPVAPVFFSFRMMVFLGILFLATFVAAFWFCARRELLQDNRRWFLRYAVWAIPLPWLAAEFGWVVAELGRQPWTIAGVLPTHLSASSLQPSDLYLSLAGFILFYTALFVIEIKLMFKYARLGPSSLHTGRYHHELAAGERAAV